MATVECSRCGQTAEPPANIPYSGADGEKIRRRVCASCWNEWLKMEVMVINELQLNFMDPKSQEVLAQHMQEFLKLVETSVEMEQRFKDLDEKSDG